MPRNSSVLSSELQQRAPHEEEQHRRAELLKRVRTNRDAILLNRGKVDGKEDKEYCWVNLNADRQIWYQTQGWEICRDPEVKTRYLRDDGTHVRGDLILYQIDKEYAQALHEYDVARGIEYLEGAEDDFETAAMRDGAPVFRPKIQ